MAGGMQERRFASPRGLASFKAVSNPTDSGAELALAGHPVRSDDPQERFWLCWMPNTFPGIKRFNDRRLSYLNCMPATAGYFGNANPVSLGACSGREVLERSAGISFGFGCRPFGRERFDLVAWPQHRLAYDRCRPWEATFVQ